MENFPCQNMRFLIVDNIKPSQEILKQYVMRLTAKQVDSTHYAQDVASICQQKSYDVILLGYDLGENQKNGQQILEELRVNSYINRHCIIILITAEISQSMVLAALEHKPDHYLCKPYSLKDLDKRLHNCLQKKKAMGKIYQALDDNNPLLVIDRCKYALSINTPYRMECLGIISRQYFELQQFEQAKEIYKAHQHSVNCQWATIGLGKVALHENKLAQAEKLFKLLIKDYPLYLCSYDWLAITYEAQFHFLFAEETLEQAIAISPRSLTRLKKYALLCQNNKHFDKATAAYESTYLLAHNSIHHCAENTIKYVQALVEYAPSLPLVDAKKISNKGQSYLKKMIRDFKETDIKIQSHFLGACLYKVSKEQKLANDEIKLGEKLLARAQNNIAMEKLNDISVILKKLNKNNLASQILIVSEGNEDVKSAKPTVSLNDKAQANIDIGLALYSKGNYLEAIEKFKGASTMFPKHTGIKLNLIQVLLVLYEENGKSETVLRQVKEHLLNLAHVKLNPTDQERLKKMQKKYQLIAGIISS
ncbi:response regulator [Colwellia piezophila]|uniref:response regulator n=1 Tax=Colwellia piezophila TaxID=211668 RepID=UPI00037303D9|nr:response regulator [Colwellia piezophila]